MSGGREWHGAADAEETFPAASALRSPGLGCFEGAVRDLDDLEGPAPSVGPEGDAGDLDPHSDRVPAFDDGNMAPRPKRGWRAQALTAVAAGLAVAFALALHALVAVPAGEAPGPGLGPVTAAGATGLHAAGSAQPETARADGGHPVARPRARRPPATATVQGKRRAVLPRRPSAGAASTPAEPTEQSAGSDEFGFER